MKIKVIGKKGIQINENLILLESNIKEVLKIFENYEAFENSYYFLDGILLFCTDHLGKIREIEIRNSEDDQIEATYDNLELFKEEKESILNYFSKLQGSPLFNDVETYYTSDELGISFSFGMSEKDIEELIQESKNDGVYEEMKDEIEHDIYRSKHLETFCIFADATDVVLSKLDEAIDDMENGRVQTVEEAWTEIDTV